MFSLKNYLLSVVFIFLGSYYSSINFIYIWKFNSLSVKRITYFLYLFSNMLPVPKYNYINWSSWSIWILILIIFCNMHKRFSFSLSENKSSKSHDIFLFYHPRYLRNINSIITNIINKSSLFFLICTSLTISSITLYKLTINIL